ncbi:DUF4290 domain-containing protein [Psychroflexus salis]|uniref:DNA phosphorothioation-dependent restriction protein DptG n=1 Tax=Psychroflexus salis TaxID=1526574 RepID=A0A916ZRT1_9FLAO|nr:DUF4290 domain-containing protein [Psychroflexus salis]GGE09825.1 hypothetical protein GCM10010831_09190 [Psychroflexus salis]
MIEDLEYNSARTQLRIPEYGRNVQKMVEHALTVDDKSKRNTIAKEIINVMGNMSPHLRDVPDFQHKLWDQLFIISDFQLDVDAPFPIPTKEELFKSPDALDYPQNHPKYRFYGNNIQLMINEAIKMEDGDLKEALVLNIANHMKKCYLNWNKDSVKDDVIFQHLVELSGGKIKLKTEEEELKQASDLVKKKPRTNTKKPVKNNRKKRNR